MTSLTGDEWAKLRIQGQITGVSVNSAPVITFRVTDPDGNAIVGLDQMYSMPPGATLPTQRTVSASIAKLRITSYNVCYTKLLRSCW